MIKFRASLLGTMIMAICLCGISVLGQDLTKGTLKGTIADINAAIVQGAAISVKNEATGSVATAVSDSDGNYVIPNLQPGTYTITVEKQGYKKAVKTGVNIAAATVTSMPVAVETGSISETVTVTASGDETLATDSSQISTTVGTRKVEDLPSNGAGGGIDTLALLVPGVVPNRGSGTNTNGTGLSVNGNRGRSNNFQIDGADNNDLSVAGPALFVDFQDAVQEFQVITTNYSAQYGRNQGAIINIVTKGGGNQFHGSAFVFHQDWKHLASLDNKEKASGQLKPDQNLYTVYGGTIGGPLPFPRFGEVDPHDSYFRSGKDRSFFYFAYQGIRNPSQSVFASSNEGILASEFSRLQTTFPGNAIVDAITKNSVFAIPGSQVRTLSISGAPAGAQILSTGTGCTRVIAVGATPGAGCIYTTPINPATNQPFLFGGAYDIVNIPNANGTPNYFQAANYQRSVNTTYDETDWSLRFDFRPTSKDSITARYIHQDSTAFNGITDTVGNIGDIPASSINYGGNWTHNLTSHLINDFRAYYQRIIVDFGGGCDVTQLYCVPGSNGILGAYTRITFGAVGLTKSGNLASIGPATNLPQGRTEGVTQLIDNMTMIAGRHTLIAGGEWKKLTTVSPFLPNVNGSYGFTGAATATRIRNNTPSAVSVVGGDPTLVFPEHDQYYYLQDDWKFRPNLTLNLGVRYEFTGQPVNVLHDLSVARENDPTRRFYDPTLPLSLRTNPVIPSDKNNWAPRVGFSYTPHFWKAIFGEDATVIRGGFSIAYDPAFYNILLNVDNAAPFAAAVTFPTSQLGSGGPSPAPLPLNPRGPVVRNQLITASLGQLNPTYLTQSKVGDDFRAPYAEQWSFGVQHRFGRKQIAEVRYVGNHAVGLFQSINDNPFIGPIYNGLNFGGPFVFGPLRGALPAGVAAQVCTDNTATPFVNEAACNGRQFVAGSITTRRNTAQSIYHGMQAQYNGKFFSDALSLGATYTFSKTIDNASEIFAGQGTNSPNAQNFYCLNSCERSLSSIDRPHAFSANFIYDVPLFKEQNGFVGKVLGGWQVNGVYILTSGQPYTPDNFINANLLGLGQTYLTAGDRPFYGNPNADRRLVAINNLDAALLFGAPVAASATTLYSMNTANTTGDWVPVTADQVKYIINGPGSAFYNFHTPYGNVPRNSERGPIFNNFNLSVFKNIQITERVRVQLRGEAFNFFNHPNPGIGVGSGGYQPTNNLTNAGVAGGAFGDNTDIEYARRVFQIGARITF
jgi:outer membrane receptor protein involved in Fe transport